MKLFVCEIGKLICFIYGQQLNRQLIKTNEIIRSKNTRELTIYISIAANTGITRNVNMAATLSSKTNLFFYILFLILQTYFSFATI